MAAPDRAWLERMLEAAERGIQELRELDDPRSRILLEDLYLVRTRLLDWLEETRERTPER